MSRLLNESISTINQERQEENFRWDLREDFTPGKQSNEGLPL